MRAHDQSERTLILAPHGRDALIAREVLLEAGMAADICSDLPEFLIEIERGAGVALITEEAIHTADLKGLAAWIAAQPPWSDFPFVLLTKRGGGIERNPAAERATATLGNVAFLERPFHPTTLISVVRMALRGRRRQYEARIHLDELQKASEAQRAAEKLASETRFRAIFDTGFQLTWLVGLDGRIIVANRTSLDVAALDDAAGLFLWASPWWALPAESKRLRQEFSRAVAGEFVRYEARFPHAGDGAATYDFSLKPVLNSKGEIIQIVAEGRDITDLKTAEAALLQSQKMETIGQLTGGVAHDFNNLLMAVLGNLDLLRRRLPDDPRLQRLVEGAMQGAQRGASLTQRLLAFARRQELHAESVDVEGLIRNMVELLQQSVGRMIEIEVDVRDKFPPAKVDPNQLELAILNLAVNARDAMQNGGKITISLDQARATSRPGEELAPATYLRLRVRDTGVGMDAKTLARAVEPFFSTKELGKGTGLGLSMVHGLAVQSGGALRLSSWPGKGTLAELLLPIATAPVAAFEGPAERQLQAAPSTILVVDDDVLIAMSTVDMLEDLGHTVIEANSGAKALDVLRTDTPIDVLMTDYAMPGMTGVELARAARELRPDLPILLATGYAELPEGTNVDFPRLAKPYQQQQLAIHLAKLLAHVGASPRDQAMKPQPAI